MCQNKTNYEKAIEYLQASPMFNLSLSSKELFHSNFLYWIWTLNNNLFKTLMGRIGAETKNWGNKWVLQREVQHHDLQVVEENKILLIIENKVKSVPDRDQLCNYAKDVTNNNGENLAKSNKIILSLITPSFSNELEEIGWTYVCHKKMVKELCCCLSNVQIEEYHKFIIKDYKNFIDSLHDIMIAFNAKPDNKYLIDKSLLEAVGDLRIKDLCTKHRVQAIEQSLKKEIDGIKVDSRYSIKTKSEYQSLSGSLLEVEIKDKNESIESFYISLCNNQYRHQIVVKSENIDKGLEKINKNKWTYFVNPQEHVSINNCYYPKGINETGQRKNYCIFTDKNMDGVFCIYQWKRIPESFTIADVVKCMVDDVEQLLRQLNK